MNLIKIKNISKTFGKEKVLNNFSWNINKGEVWALVGANGSGKTTLLNILIGLGEADEGNIEYKYSFTKHFSEKIGFLFQNNTYPKNLTPEDVIEIYKKSYFYHPKILEELTNLLMIRKIMKKKIKHLSGGELQKLNILLVFLSEPEIIMLDEFSNNLDINTKVKIRLFFKEYIKRNNATAIIVSHDINEITDLCNKLIYIDQGKAQLFVENSEFINEKNVTNLFLKQKIN